MPKHSIEKSCRYHKFIGNSRNKKECVFLCNRELLHKKWTILISLGSPIFSIFIHIFISSDISLSRAADQPETASPVHNKPQLRQGRSPS